mmetsp:Transcript_4827/g.14614  ORF Transcript_4827/g.14614 Transcript_4827/m.14614 type:complete len:503 (+) Transcript_4827:46-1554(+)|eukprot:CAMPEP_0197393930 /NCGR_PEP_ID=MMETSP1165-20131217/4595_1 /TAXON_ID=284809 /ORGANISM="Chrysocystis fragilis, Strain CCMP3189" /LENGTH=502 /DNA_ID=CAMNT_0042919609 /DNA_START=46 /DNA_END=1554 /DNA_ORIENTATION=-
MFAPSRLVTAVAFLVAAAAQDETETSWYKNGSPSKDCAWVGSIPALTSKRCLVKGFDKTLALDACSVCTDMEDGDTGGVVAEPYEGYDGPVDYSIEVTTPCDGTYCFNRWHPKIPMALTVPSGSVVEFTTVDIWDEPGWDKSDFPDAKYNMDLAFDRINIVHIMTGPLGIEGAVPGDKLAVEILDITPMGQGFTMAGPGLGFIDDLLVDDDITWTWWNYSAEGDSWHSAQFPDVIVPYTPFPGNIGVLPDDDQIALKLTHHGNETTIYGGPAWPVQTDLAIPADLCGAGGTYEDECLRTLAPGQFFGNTDTQRMARGTTLLVDCMVEECGLAIGDVHGGQGDGEVSITAIEFPSKVTVRVTIIKPDNPAYDTDTPKLYGTTSIVLASPTEWVSFMGYPFKDFKEVPSQYKGVDGSALAYTNSAIIPESISLAGRNALLKLCNFLQSAGNFTFGESLVLASAIGDLRIAQLVDKPAVGVEAILPLNYFTGKTYDALKAAAYPF